MRGVSYLCSHCYGSGLRYPIGGDLVYAGHERPIGNLDWDDDDVSHLTPSIAPEFTHLMPAELPENAS